MQFIGTIPVKRPGALSQLMEAERLEVAATQARKEREDELGMIMQSTGVDKYPPGTDPGLILFPGLKP